jgi:hypothetical protein
MCERGVLEKVRGQKCDASKSETSVTSEVLRLLQHGHTTLQGCESGKCDGKCEGITAMQETVQKA